MGAQPLACLALVDAADVEPAPALVEARATDLWRALARSLAGRRLDNVVAIKSARISMKVEPHTMSQNDMVHQAHGMPHAPAASFWVPGLASIVTRPLDEGDHACGNEVVAYEPLSRGASVLPAYTLGHQFKGQGLGTTWDDPNCRSSFVGHFAL